MIERALLTVFLSLVALGAISEIGAKFHPMSMVADHLTSIECVDRGWSKNACKEK
jgi:hypothetical protein